MNALRRLAVCTAALMIMTCLPVFSAGKGWTAPFEGSGTPEEPFLISSAEELCALADAVNAGADSVGLCFLLTEDIDLSGYADWTPVGNGLDDGSGGAYAFCGELDGGGHTVSGLTVSGAEHTRRGLFGLTQGGSVWDLTIDGASVGGASNAGALVGESVGTVIENVRVEAYVFGQTALGGIAGCTTGGRIADCSAETVIEGVRSVGGIIGSARDTRVERCASRTTAAGDEFVGGIVGIGQSVSMEDCSAEGSADAEKDAGGLIGYCFDSEVTNCVSGVSVSGRDRAGGSAGLAVNTQFTDCTNLGGITGERFAGGLCGTCAGGGLTRCVNTASVCAREYTGGLLGFTDDGQDSGDSGLDCTVSQCMNTGAVRGTWGVGGLIGDAHDAFVFDSFNIAPVSAEEYAGGVVGYAAESGFTRCYNAGRVASGYPCGGVVGRVPSAGADFINCCYIDSCCEGNGFGTGLDAYGMLEESAYAGFDFGSVWTIEQTGYPYARLVSLASPLPLSGDSDGDGRVTSSDALLTLRCAMGLVEPAPLERFRADCDGDGAISAQDAVYAMRVSMGY